MDVETLLNACLETHQKDEIRKAQEAARKQKDIIEKSLVAKLFKSNGEFVCDVAEFTVSQSRSLVPIYSIGNDAPIYTIHGKLSLTGTFQTSINVEDLSFTNNTYFLEADVIHPEGGSSRVHIIGLYFTSVAVNDDSKIIYTFSASTVESIDTKTRRNPWMSN